MSAAPNSHSSASAGYPYTSTTASRRGDTLSIDMAQWRTSVRLTDCLAVDGLGASIALCVYDSPLKAAGIACVVLPEPTRRHVGADRDAELRRAPAKYAVSAVALLIEQVCSVGGRPERLRAAIVGGASVFGQEGEPGSGFAAALDIGGRSAALLRAALEARGVALCGADIGGSHGRAVAFRVCDGAVVSKPVGGAARVVAVLSRGADEAAP